MIVQGFLLEWETQAQHMADGEAAPGRLVKLDRMHLPEHGAEGDTWETLGRSRGFVLEPPSCSP